MKKLYLRPNQSNYSATKGKGFIQTQLDGGASRFRRDYIGAARLVDVSWTLKASEYLYLTSFYNTSLQDGSEPFKIDLILDSFKLTEHVAHFTQESFNLDGQSGLSISCSAQLEVLPKRGNPDLDELIVQAFQNNPNVDTTAITLFDVYPEVEVDTNVLIQAFAFNHPWVADDGVTVIDQTGQGNHGTLVGHPDEISALLESGILGLSPHFAVGIQGIVGYEGIYHHGVPLSDPTSSIIHVGRRTHSIGVDVTEGIGVMDIESGFEVG